MTHRSIQNRNPEKSDAYRARAAINKEKDTNSKTKPPVKTIKNNNKRNAHITGAHTRIYKKIWRIKYTYIYIYK